MKSNFSVIRHKGENLYLLLSIVVALIIIFITKLLGGIFYVLLFFIGLIISIRISQRSYLGDSLKVSERHFYRIKIITEQLCDRANLPEPDIYVQFYPTPNAFTLGFSHPYTIVLTSALVENLTEDELETVIAHELGHAYFHHPRISTFFNMMNNQLNIFFNFFYQLTLIGFWNRATEYTADNFSLLLTKNPQSIISALIKIYVSPKYEDKIDEEQILNQFKLYKKDIFSVLGELQNRHPYFVKRVNNIINLHRKLGQEYYKRGSDIFCPHCGKKIQPNSKYCIFCGNQL